MRQSSDILITSLAATLVGSQVKSEAVGKSLQLICDSLFFDNGLVYEIDNSDHFNLMERFISNETSPRKSFPVDELTLEHRGYLTKSIVSLISKGPRNTSCESELLDMFSAYGLALAPVVDESLNVYGLIAFVKNSHKGTQENLDPAIISVPISMLIRYVALRMYQNKLSRARISLESILDNAGIDIYVNDFYTHDILYVNKSMAEPYGGQEQFFGKKCWQVLFPGQSGPCEFCPQKKIVGESGEPSKVYTWDYQRPFDGSWFRVFSAAFRWVDGRLAHVVSSADITDNKEKEALIRYMANYDALTNLPNRRMLVSDCKRRIDHASSTESVYLLFFDIDGFKLINDNYGHDAGDEFLKKLGDFFTGIPLLKDSIYRNGGDEFVAILGGESISKENVQNLARFILARFKKPWSLKCGDIFCNTSIGVACFPEDGNTAEELLRKSDMAMYQVKKGGGGGACFGYQIQKAL